MGALKRLIPLWIKAPLSVFLNEHKKLPCKLVMAHVKQSFLLHRSISEERRAAALAVSHQANYKYLSKLYAHKVPGLAGDYSQGAPSPVQPIWVLWWQGEHDAPAIVKNCIASMRKNAGHHPVYVIDQNNYSDFAHISPCILNKLKNGSLSFTHFSDYYRMALLAQNGGLWIDASIFVQQPICDDLFAHPLFTMRNPDLDTSNISGWNWTVGVIGGWKGNTLFQITADLLELYWQDHDFLIDYFIFDYMIRIVYDSLPAVKAQIDAIPPNNRDFYLLQKYVNSPAVQYEDIFLHDPDTWLYKLSWKGSYVHTTPSGEPSVFHRWLKENTPT